MKREKREFLAMSYFHLSQRFVLSEPAEGDHSVEFDIWEPRVNLTESVMMV